MNVNIDISFYKTYYPDLAHLNDAEILNHYKNHGIKEGRLTYSNQIVDTTGEPLFDIGFYKAYYSDLSLLNEVELLTHYKNYGRKENRLICHSKIVNTTQPCNTINDNEYNVELFPFNEYFINTKLIKNSNITSNQDNNKNYDTFHSDDVLITRKYLSDKHHEHLDYKIDNGLLKILKEFIFVLDFQNGGGGTTFFINTIVSKYKNSQTFVIARNYNGLLHLNINEEYDLNDKLSETESIDFLNTYKNAISKIFVNHTMNHNDNFINKINTLGKQIITITHDYYNICNKPQPYFHEIKFLTEEPKIKSDLIITQNKINLLFFNTPNANIQILELPDYKKSDVKFKFDDNNENIVVGIIGNINTLKGKNILKKIINHFCNTNIKIIVIGYTEIDNFKNYYYYNSIDEFNNILMEQKPNLLLELSIWPETYSYTLTLSMLTQLPILCLKKKFNSIIENRLKKYSKTYYFSSLLELTTLIKTKYQNYLYTILPVLYFDIDWNNIFLTNTNKMQIDKCKSNFIHDLKPYFIYFPQFHKIRENDLFFYEGFTDTKNLKLYNENNDVKLETPLLEYLNLKNIDDYDLTNEEIIQKQINLINYYNFSGIALYYYWFSTNNITNKHQIMEKVINNFFTSNVNMMNLKCFFIWANEDWTSNKAFGLNNDSEIINEYNEENFIKNANNLIEYFKNDNYLKIYNKPVFFIYHNHLIENIDLFYNILNNVCIKHNFNGVHFVLNSFVDISTKYPNFYINFNYKKNDARFYDENKKQIKLNYKEYIDNDYHLKHDCIQTISTQFNNKPRLFRPNKLMYSTVCINNSEINKIVFIKKIIQLYKNKNMDSELSKLLLVNSFNEWGENMAFEPSDKYNYYYMNLLFDCLIV